ncbi:MAG: 4Fe-4S dicluster domain-containing protein, partial [Candidatus Eisenbacteria bacterium]|nr:4Fe-4S dicluster domain-containing protein [Candidatus Eisenbacteria bacterium]
VIMPAVAVDAGLGELSRAGYLLSKGVGLNTRLAVVTTDLPMPVDPPARLGVQDFCAKCRKCAECCPADCIPTGGKIRVRGVEKWKIDEEQCLLYWGRIGVACTICQVVCPWSKPRSWWHRAIAEIAIRVPWSRRFLVWADDLVYGRRHRRRATPAWLQR